MTSPWVEDDELTDWEAPAAADDDGQTGTPLPYVDPEVAAELAGEGPPVWMGTRWREIEAEHQWEAWNTLRRWVDWFVAEYRLVTSVVPPCWYKHSDLTAELYAAMCMEYKVWEEQAPGLGPMMMWHPHVEMLTARLRRMVDEAYATFRHPAVAPLVQTDADTYVLELFHGPTLAFKDVAMQLLGRLMDHVLRQRGSRATIVGATSGDTGSAAVEPTVVLAIRVAGRERR